MTGSERPLPSPGLRATREAPLFSAGARGGLAWPIEAINRLDFDFDLPPTPPFLERLNRWFDRLTEAQRIASVVLGILLLASASMYFLGLGSTVLVNRTEATRASLGGADLAPASVLESTPVRASEDSAEGSGSITGPVPTLVGPPPMGAVEGSQSSIPTQTRSLLPGLPVPQPQRPRIVSTPDAGAPNARSTAIVTPARSVPQPTAAPAAPTRVPARATAQPLAPTAAAPASKPTSVPTRAPTATAVPKPVR